MVTCIVRHRVKDFGKWKPFFDEHDKVRAGLGQISYELYRGTDDPNLVIIKFEYESAEKARKFIESGDLRAVMDKAGVIDRPDIFFLDKVAEKKPATATS